MIPKGADRLLSISIATTIGGYQKYLSPYKGFSCAYRCLYGGESCSQFAKRVVLAEGAVIAWQKLSDRFQECKQANRILRSRNYANQAQEEEGAQKKRKIYPYSPKQRRNSQPWEECCGTSTNQACNGCTDFNCGMVESDCNVFDRNEADCSGIDCNPCDGNGCGLEAAECNGLDCGGADCSSCGN